MGYPHDGAQKLDGAQLLESEIFNVYRSNVSTIETIPRQHPNPLSLCFHFSAPKLIPSDAKAISQVANLSNT